MRTAIAILALLLTVPALAAQTFAIDEKPREFLTIRVDGATRDWQIRPTRITDAGGRVRQGATEGDFRPVVERWPGLGLPKRNDVKLWESAAARYLGAAATEGDRFYFRAIQPTQPRADGVLQIEDIDNRQFWVPAKSVKIVGWPQTWVDVFERYVLQFTGDARRQAVVDWEAAHRSIINSDDDGGFRQHERNEFARFYQAQFVYVRNDNPKDPRTYDELAAFHRERNNLDAELSSYLDALRVGVPSPDRERFALEVGRIFVQRLGAHREAMPYLTIARNHTLARYLLAECHMVIGDMAAARTELAGLVELLRQPPADGSIILETGTEAEGGRANLLLGEIEFKELNYSAALTVLARIVDGNPYRDHARVLTCAIILQREGPPGFPRIRDELRKLTFWQSALALTSAQGNVVYPLDPLMARALVLYAESDNQFREPRSGDSTVRKPNAEVLRFLNAAKAIDPLSAEPWYTEGRLHQRLGSFPDAYDAFRQGLLIDPRHVAMNYSMAELHLKAGLISVAQQHLGVCLKYAPAFYAAHAMLGEIALLEVELARESLAIRAAAGENVDFAGELVPPMKEAAAFFTSALAANADQPATQLALATLHLRLAEVVPLTISRRGDAEAVRRAHLTKARDLARQLMDKLEEMTAGEPIRNPTERQIAALPSLACYNVYAYALYALGQHEAALEAFKLHVEKARNQRYIPDGNARKLYGESAHFAYAANWIERIEQNQRQYFQIEEFREDSKDAYYGVWKIPLKLKPDLGFQPNTRIRGGRLILGVDQKETGLISRLETEQPHATLAVFEAEFVKVGEQNVDWGIHLTKSIKATSRSSAEPDPVAGLKLGIDADGRVFWEAWRFERDASKPQPDRPRESGYISPDDFGGRLVPERPLTLALKRVLGKDRSSVEYIAVVDGYEVLLPVKMDDLTKADFNTGRFVMMCGFFTRGFAGTKASIEVERVKFIFDDGIAGRR